MQIDILDLKSSPMFNLSLASKELFHSNFLAWLAEDSDTEAIFTSVLLLFGLNENKAFEYSRGIRDGAYIVLREYNNFDFCICVNEGYSDAEYNEGKPGKVLFVLENKFKSIPNTGQLQDYQKKIRDINKDSRYVCDYAVLSLAREICGVEIKHNNFISIEDITNETVEWKFISYNDYARCLLEHITDIEAAEKSSYKRELVRDYASSLSTLCGYLSNLILNRSELEKKEWNKLDVIPELKKIRMSDVQQKLLTNVVADILASKFANHSFHVHRNLKIDEILTNKVGVGDCVVNAGFSRGTGIIEAKLKVDESYVVGIQIQGKQYKRLIEISEKDVRSDGNSYTGPLNHYKAYFRVSPSAEDWEGPYPYVFSSDNIYPLVCKSVGGIPYGFNRYGDTFIYQSKHINHTSKIGDVLTAIVNDILLFRGQSFSC